MKKFDGPVLGRMVNRIGTPFVYRPFPGRFPVRLHIRITLNDERANAKWIERFGYNGKWSYSILRKALRVWNGLLVDQSKNPHLMLNCGVTEYCQTGALYHGDLHYGIYTQGQPLAYLFGLGNKGTLRMQDNYNIEKLVPVRCDNFSMMVPEQTAVFAQSRKQKNLLYQEMRKARKRWEAA